MKKLIITLTIIILITSCGTVKQDPPKTFKEGRKEFYENEYKSIIIMPAINKTNDVALKDNVYQLFHTPLVNHGYYVMPPMLTYETLQQESAYDSEMFIDGDLSKFQEIFGADLAVFPIIHETSTSSGKDIYRATLQFIIKDLKTNATIYDRTGTVYREQEDSKNAGEALLKWAVKSAVNSMNSDELFMEYSQELMYYTFMDMPKGPYHDMYGLDKESFVGPETFKYIKGSVFEARP